MKTTPRTLLASLVTVAFVAANAAPAGAAPPEVPDASLALPASPLSVHTTFRPNPAMQARIEELDRQAKQGDMAFAAGDVTTVGEIVVMEGDDTIVTTFDASKDQYGLRYDNQRQDPYRITERFFEHFDDEYDFIVVWTTFWDYGAEGLAYYVGVRNSTQGIGQPTYSNAWSWGSSQGGRLQGFLNMKAIALYGNIANPNNQAYPVMGQEITHRFLAFLEFVDDDGQISKAMLGRDESHWSALLHAYASVQDGNWWQDNGNGTFTSLGSMAQFSPLDLYAMGMVGAEEVEDWFLIENATYKGQPVGALTQIPQGTTLSGTRKDISIDQVIAAHGPRVPSVDQAQKHFRVAYVLVTRPGEGISQVQSELSDIETFRTIWDDKFTEWTGGRGTICSRVTSDCDRALIGIESVAIDDDLIGDGDGMPEPGETVLAHLTVVNNGTAPAEGVLATVEVPEGMDITVNNPVTTVPDLGPGESAPTTEAFGIVFGPDAPCGEEIELPVTFEGGGITAKGRFTLPIGVSELWRDDFDEDRGWTINEDGADTAQKGQWERSTPEGVDAGYLGVDITTQPGTDKSGSGAALVTGASGGQLGEFDIDDGVTSVWSPSIDLAGAVDPSLSFWTWRIGLDFNDPSGNVVPEDNDVLTVEISGDNGATWVLVDSDTTNDQTWRYKELRIRDFLEPLPATLRMRVIARDLEPQSLSEAAIDEVRVFELQDTCFGTPWTEPVDEPVTDPGTDPGTTDPGTDPGTTDPGTDPGTTDPNLNGDGLAGAETDGCDAGGGGSTPWALLAAALLALVLRRRRGARA